MKNLRSKEEMPVHERFEQKRKILNSREVNRLKEQNYGKWYLRPNDFNKKIVKLNKKFESLNRALGL